MCSDEYDETGDILSSERRKGAATVQSNTNQQPTLPLSVSPCLQAAYGRFHDHLATLPEEAQALGALLVAKLMPPQWSIEWYLPEWLGDTMGLPAGQIETIVLANIFGLCHVVLQDRMIDEGSEKAFTGASVLLNGALEQWWLVTYARMFGHDAWFWRCFDEIMEQWRCATAISNRHPRISFEAYLQKDWRQLAHRAAPLKTCCAAICCLARHEEQMPLLEQILDHMHVATVLLDHAHDWDQDSEAGRYNAFVHFAAQTETELVDAKTARRAVYEELWWGEQASPYFSLAKEHLATALVYAAQVNCPPLTCKLEADGRQLTEYQEALVGAAQAWLHRATEELFGDPQR